MNRFTCNTHEIILYIITSSWTVAISLNPLFVEFPSKMRKSPGQDESSPSFEKVSVNEYTVLLLARTILSDGLVSAQNYALSRRRFFPVLSPMIYFTTLLYACDERMGYSSSESVNISVMIESGSFGTAAGRNLLRHDYRNLMVLYGRGNMENLK